MRLIELFSKTNISSKTKKKNLYIKRKVLNADDIVEWAKSQGIQEIVAPDNLHITVAYSKTKIDWNDIPDSFDHIKLGKSKERSLDVFGKALVLRVESITLQNRWQELCDLGCSWDYNEYKPHITIDYEIGDFDWENIEPYNGVIKLGPEIYEILDDERNNDVITLTENIDISPNKFWLCLDIPTSSQSDVAWIDRDLARLSDISNGKLNGVQGISDSREIVTQFFHSARNAFIVMDGKQVLANNDIQKIQYDKPEELCKQNMKILYRLFDKVSDKKYNRVGLMMTVCQYIFKHLDNNTKVLVEYSGLATKIGDEYGETIVEINSIGELVSYIFNTAKQIGEKPSGYRYQVDIDLSNLTKAVQLGLREIGKMYSDENEWMVSNRVFNIPKGSHLVIGIEKEQVKDYNNWVNTKEETLYNSFNKYALEKLDNLLRIIHEYDLDQYYKINFVDNMQFAKMQPVVMSRRREAKKPLKEGTLAYRDGEFMVITNPSIEQMNHLFDVCKNPKEGLRAILSKSNLLFTWDSYYKTHMEVAKILGLDLTPWVSNNYCMHLYPDMVELELDCSIVGHEEDVKKAVEKLWTHRSLDRFFGYNFKIVVISHDGVKVFGNL